MKRLVFVVKSDSPEESRDLLRKALAEAAKDPANPNKALIISLPVNSDLEVHEVDIP